MCPEMVSIQTLIDAQNKVRSDQNLILIFGANCDLWAAAGSEDHHFVSFETKFESKTNPLNSK